MIVVEKWIDVSFLTLLQSTDNGWQDDGCLNEEVHPTTVYYVRHWIHFVEKSMKPAVTQSSSAGSHAQIAFGT